MRISQGGQRPDLGYAVFEAASTTSRTSLLSGNRLVTATGSQILDGVDDMLVVLGLEALHLQQAHPRQFRGHPAARLHRHVAHRHPRQHVQDDAALAAGEVARGKIGPITQLLSGAIDGLGVRGEIFRPSTSLSTSLTVAVDTPTNRATSALVGRASLFVLDAPSPVASGPRMPHGDMTGPDTGQRRDW